jgi:competence protein ComEC
MRKMPTLTDLFPRERWVLWLPVGLGIGAGVFFTLPADPPPAWFWAPLPLLLLAVIGWRRIPVRLVGLLLLSLTLGFSAAMLRTERLATRTLAEPLGPVTLFGTVVDTVPALEGKGDRLILTDIWLPEMSEELRPQQVQAKLRGDKTAFPPGTRVKARVKLFPLPRAALPGGFDFARNSWFKGIGAVGFAYGMPVQVESKYPVNPSLTDRFTGIRQRLTQRIVQVLPGAEGSIAAALMTGERAHIPDAQNEALRVAGLSHILSISGLHIGLVTAAVFFGFRRMLALIPAVALRVDSKKAASVLAAVASFCYLMLAGMPVPGVRAYAMACFVLLAVLLSRSVTPIRILAWAAVLILLLVPENIWKPSFQLSFAATLAILALYDRDREPFEEPPAFWIGKLWRFGSRYFKGIVLTSLVAGFATLPITLYHFRTMSLYGVLGNLVGLPLTSLWIMPGAMLTFLLMPFGKEALVLPWMGEGIATLLRITEWIAGLPLATLSLPAPSLAGVLVTTFGGLWLMLWTGWVRWFGIVAILLGMATGWEQHPPKMLVGEKHIALRLEAGDWLWITPGRRGFGEQQWEEYYTPALFRKAKEDKSGVVTCDKTHCTVTDGPTQWWIQWKGDTPAATACSHHRIVLGPKVSGEIPCGIQVTESMLRVNGTHALYWENASGVSIRTTREETGARQWHQE